MMFLKRTSVSNQLIFLTVFLCRYFLLIFLMEKMLAENFLK